MTLEQLRQWLQHQIEPVYGKQESAVIARTLLYHFGDTSPSAYQLIKHNTASPQIIDSVKEAIPMLLNYTPLQYITGRAWFCDLLLEVKPGVLIPRPETEEMVMMIIKTLNHDLPHNTAILDIGTGSGAIAITLARQWEYCKVHAMDLSLDALEIARQNAIRNKVHIEFLQGDILDESYWPALPGELHLIVSNPPYVLNSERALMKLNVLKHEPGIALFVPDDDALLFYRQIGRFARKNLRSGGRLWLEINESYPRQVEEFLLEEGFSNIKNHRDFRDKFRFISAVNEK